MEIYCQNVGTSPEELVGILLGREVVYSFFYEVFIKKPDERFFNILSHVIEGLEIMASDFTKPESKDAILMLKNLLKKRMALSGSEQKEYDTVLLQQYTQMFCLTNSIRACESHYSTPDRLSRQVPQDKSRELYAEFKISKDPEYFEDEDFIANQMRFMAILSGRSAESLMKCDVETFRTLLKAQRSFIENHICKWINDFVHEVEEYESAKTLYLPTCIFMLGFIDYDRVFLESINE